MCTTRDINRATTSGEVNTTKVCAHPTPGPRKAGPSLDGGVLSVWVPTASWNSACARQNKGTTPLQGKGAHEATTAAAPAKRSARLDDRLSSDGGSAQWREWDSRQHSNIELTRLGPASARRPGPHQGEGGFSPRILDTAARRRGGAEEEDRGSACCRRSRAARRRLQQIRVLLLGGDLTTDGFFLPRAALAPGRTAMESKPQAQD
jgi:hypothetical protein